MFDQESLYGVNECGVNEVLTRDVDGVSEAVENVAKCFLITGT